MGFHADGIDADVGAYSTGFFQKAVVDVFIANIDSDGSGIASHFHAIGHAALVVERDHFSCAKQKCATNRELADGSATPDGDGIVGLRLGVLDGHVSGGENVGEENELMIWQVG